VADVQGVTLNIERAGTRFWRFVITYTVEFSDKDVGAWYTETVELRAGKPGNDRGLRFQLKHSPWKVERPGQDSNCVESYTVQRTTGPQEVHADVLDERRDVTIYGDRVQVVFVHEDQLFARVRITPLARPGWGDSPPQTGQFGRS
jgi:hypothetical protein